MTTKSIYPTLIALGMAAGAHAAVIQPITATSTGTSTQNGDAGTSINNLVNGSGLSAPPSDEASLAGITHSTSLTDLWVTSNNGSDFFVSPPGTVQIDFDLNGAYDLSTVYIWGYGYFGTTNSASDITVSYSTDGISFGNAESILLPSNSVTSVQSVGLNATAGTTHVRFLINDNLGAGDRVGLGEVRFGGELSAVPEPSSTALLGLGGLALILRRRK